jgi:tetratricopeptide (TPR) repeat protein
VLQELVNQSTNSRALEPLLRACAEAAVLEVSEDTWRFSHDRLRDRLLADLSAEERRALHLRVGNAMEARYREVPSQAAVLAHHFQQAGERSRSAHYTLLAGEQALLTGALSEAVTLLSAARDQQAHLDVTPLQRARVLRMLASALWGLGRFSESLPILEHALALLGAPPSRGGLRIGAALLGLSGRQLLHRLLPRSLAVRTPRSAEERQVLEELLQVILGSGEMYAWVGDQTQLLLGALLSVNLAERLDDGQALVMLYAVMGFLGEMMRLPAMRDHYLALAEARLSTVNDVKAEAELYRITAALHVMKGQWGSAQRLYDRAITLSRSLGHQPIYFFNLTQRATVHYWRGDYAAADVDVALLLDEARRDGFPQYQVWALGTVGALALRRGALNEARKALDEGIEIARKEQAIPSQIFIAGLRALTTLRQGDKTNARRMADETRVEIGRTAHTGHGALEGYLSTIETYLELAEAEPSKDTRDELLSIIEKLLPGMHRYARLIPIGGARAALLQARLSALRGKYSAALASLRQSLAVAQQCALPYDEALAHRWLVELAPQGRQTVRSWPDARIHHAAAQQLFARIGAVDTLGDR